PSFVLIVTVVLYSVCNYITTDGGVPLHSQVVDEGGTMDSTPLPCQTETVQKQVISLGNNNNAARVFANHYH
ncbi:hypothetical protein HID58_018585, partial [Brassica napus]